MCGIAGIIGELGPGNRAALDRMGAAMRHRGPDGDGSWESERDGRGWGALLAHRRLAILDLSGTGAQPMTDPHSGRTVVLNGEIYNYREIRDDLARRGHRFHSTGDTEVMLRALGADGYESIARLRGMFAFASWDPSTRRLLLARDELGIKPLYLARNPDRNGTWAVAFASEVRALLASGLLGASALDPTAVASVVWNGFVAGPGTAVRGVELLAGGRALEFDGWGAQRLDASFAGRTSEPGLPLSEEDFASRLAESVRLHLESDVPIAVFLSSGVDSSAVANLAQRASAAPVHTFTLSFEGAPELDEGPAARDVAEAIGSVHHEVTLSEGEFVSGLDSALDSMDQPTFDGLNSYVLARSIRMAGFTVALVGTGGDELFGGYASFRDLPILHRWARRMPFVSRELLAAAAQAMLALASGRRAAIPPQTRWAKLPAMVRRGEDLVALYQLAYAIFLPDFQRELLDGEFAQVLSDGLQPGTRDRLIEESRDLTPLAALSAMERRMFLGERLLRDNDVASMAFSVEQRLPFVDRDLLRAAERLPDPLRFSPVGRKALLRRLGLSGLPPALFDRPKRGFVLPYARWIRAGLQRTIDETLRDDRTVRAAGLQPEAVQRLWRGFLDGAPGLYWSRVWAVFVLLRWCQRNGVFR